jgi:hypothetical protein
MTGHPKTGLALMALIAWVTGCATTASPAPPPKEAPVTAVKTTETKETKTATRNRAVLKWIGHADNTAGSLFVGAGAAIPDVGGFIRKKPQALPTKSRPNPTKTGPTKGKLVPKIRIGTPIVMGHCKASDVARVLRRRLPGFLHCYQRRLDVHPNLRGKTTLAFTIGAPGRVSQASTLQGTLKSPQLAACLIHKARKMRFPEPEKYTCSVKAPMGFSSKY